MTTTPTPLADDSRRPAIRRMLEQRFGRAIPVTAEMIDAILADLDDESDEPASPATQGLTHVEALLLAVLRDWPGAHSVPTLADRRRLIGVQVSAIRLTADTLARSGLVERAGFGSEYRITDAGHDALTAHERDQST